MNYKEKYLFYCNQLNDCSTKKEVKIHNHAMKKLSMLYRQVEKIENKTFLLDLLKDENLQTRCLVASHCLGLGVYIRKAKFVLLRLSFSKKNLVLAFEAKNILKVYKEQGYLIF